MPVRVNARAVETARVDRAGIRWLTPRVVLRRIDIAGDQGLSEQTIRDALGVGVGSEIKQEQLAELQRSVAKLYATNGYLGAQIDVGLRDTDDPSVKVLLVRVEQGTPTRIVRIAFAGEQPLDPGRVVLSMQSAVGDVLDRNKLEQDARSLEEPLRRRGFYEAAIGVPLVTITHDEAAVAIPSRIGPRYRVVLRGHAPFGRSEMNTVLALDTERLTLTHLRHTLAERLHAADAATTTAARSSVMHITSNEL